MYLIKREFLSGVGERGGGGGVRIFQTYEEPSYNASGRMRHTRKSRKEWLIMGEYVIF